MRYDELTRRFGDVSFRSLEPAVLDELLTAARREGRLEEFARACGRVEPSETTPMGWTRPSDLVAAEELPKIGKLLFVEGRRERSGMDAVVDFVGLHRTIRFGGYQWGYGGTGPQGLCEAMVICGVPRERAWPYIQAQQAHHWIYIP